MRSVNSINVRDIPVHKRPPNGTDNALARTESKRMNVTKPSGRYDAYVLSLPAKASAPRPAFWNFSHMAVMANPAGESIGEFPGLISTTG
jgi:hypothetical protein